jgi:UDP-2-acetamido-2,6-beta-L-arabino-hexul-4-ose reductase
MRIVITGADGFIGKNLTMRLAELGYTDVVRVTLDTLPSILHTALAQADFVFHLAGVNRPQNPTEFAAGNAGLTQTVCTALAAAGRRAVVAFASSTQVELGNPYGRSKLAAEVAVREYAAATGARVHVFRLTNVFGKWAQPNYNSVVATFCHNIARGLPITINDPAALLHLVHVDDVVAAFVCLLVQGEPASICATTSPGSKDFADVEPIYTSTVGEVAQTLQRFADSRNTLLMPPVATGLVRALYSTYVSYLPIDKFAYLVPQHADPRGVFVEMLKSADCGQISYFTAHPGITRGRHYHHSKTEKFLVIRGLARFRFRHVQTGETHEVLTSGEKPEIVETVPGWAHDITNIGTDEMIVMLWANEVFDQSRPDTFSCPV